MHSYSNGGQPANSMYRPCKVQVPQRLALATSAAAGPGVDTLRKTRI